MMMAESQGGIWTGRVFNSLWPLWTQNRSDQIVVYKIDRLTRSLADFAKLVDRLDEAGASFVSVTQSFNTSTSMGRLTLNVLLSFAQFEREVTAERIRDKIAASKRKGLWMGGNVPLGYEPDGRTLVINTAEAEVVRKIYDLYETEMSMNAVRARAADLELRSKLRTKADGSQTGGRIMSRGQLHHILTNPIYAGRIRHKGKIFEGQHQPIIDPARWGRIQAAMQEKAAKPRLSKQHRDPSPLAGKIFDGAGERLTPSHTKKGERRYRYYISKRLVTGTTSAEEKQGTWRIPAGQIEGPVMDAVRAQIMQLRALRQGQMISNRNHEDLDDDQIWQSVQRVTVEAGVITVQLDAHLVADLLGRDTSSDHGNDDTDALTISLPFRERRRGVEMKLATKGSGTIDETLLRNIAQAHQWYARIKQGASFEDIASDSNTSKRRVQQVIPLAFLAPDIVRQITLGTQPIGLTSDWLVRHGLPTDWAAQQERIARL